MKLAAAMDGARAAHGGLLPAGLEQQTLPMNLFQKLHNCWQGRHVALTPPSSADEIVAFEKRHGLELPAASKEYRNDIPALVCNERLNGLAAGDGRRVID